MNVDLINYAHSVATRLGISNYVLSQEVKELVSAQMIHLGSEVWVILSDNIPANMYLLAGNDAIGKNESLVWNDFKFRRYKFFTTAIYMRWLYKSDPNQITRIEFLRIIPQ